MTEFPQLGERTITGTGGRRRVDYSTSVGPVEVLFQFERDAWAMVALRF